MFKYKIDMLKTLSDKGYTSYYFRQNKIIGEREMQKIRHGGMPSWKTLNIFCNLLQCQISDIIEHVPDREEE